MKTRCIIIASLAVILLGIYMVGRNASQANQLANQVMSQDAAGGSLTNSEQQLSSYVHGHMGSSITVFLSSSYNRAVASAAAAAGSTGQVYHDAQAACVSRTTAVVQAQCVQSYLAAHPDATATAPVVDKTPYSLSYTAPHWTPDPAGLVLVLGGLGLITAAGWWLRRRI